MSSSQPEVQMRADVQETAGQLYNMEALLAAYPRTSSPSTSGKAGLAHFSICTTGTPRPLREDQQDMLPA